MISSDTSLSKNPVLKAPNAGGLGGGLGGNSIRAQSTFQAPNYIDPSAAIGNTLAQGDMMAAGAIKKYDRAGVSRGKGQAARAGVDSAQALGQARNQAAQTQMQADQTNAGMKLDFQHGQEMEGQKLAMIQHAMSQSDWSVGMAQQAAAAKIRSAQQQAALNMFNAWG